MPIIEGIKFSCQPCIKGHRSAHCTHPDRPLVEIKKKGRPPTQCTACRELRKQGHHSRCTCEARSTEVKSAPLILPEGCAGVDLHPLSLGSTSTSTSSSESSTPAPGEVPVELATVGRKKSITRRRDLALATGPHGLAHGFFHAHAAGTYSPYPAGLVRGGAVLSRSSSTRSNVSEASLSHASSSESPVVPPTPISFPTLPLPAPLTFPLPALKSEEPVPSLDDLDYSKTPLCGPLPEPTQFGELLDLDELLAQWNEHRGPVDPLFLNTGSGELTSGSESNTTTSTISGEEELDLQFGAELAKHGDEWIEQFGLNNLDSDNVDSIARWREDLPAPLPGTAPRLPPTPYSYSPLPSPPPQGESTSTMYFLPPPSSVDTKSYSGADTFSSSGVEALPIQEYDFGGLSSYQVVDFPDFGLPEEAPVEVKQEEE